jgi:phosphoribosylformimino-5-aminoimidazole carboxamide ribotide isomerase
MQIIPAIDILNGKVVRLTKGDYNQVENYPVSIKEMIEKYALSGIDFIHIVDLNGAKGEFINQSILEKLVKNLPVKIQLGGGIRTVYKATELIDSGVSRVIVGTAAIVENDFLKNLSMQTNPEKVVLGIDVLDQKLKVNGWQSDVEITLNDYIVKAIDLGYSNFLCTDISKDGLLQGPSIELYNYLLELFPTINLIASGGVKDMEDIKLLSQTQANEVVVGKAIYEGFITLEEIQNWNSITITNNVD